MDDPIIEDLGEIIDEYSVPEVIEALITIATHYKDELKRDNNREYLGWENIEHELTRTLKAIGGV